MAKRKFDLAEEASNELITVDRQDIEIIDKPDFEMMSMADYQAAKNMLAERRKSVVLQLDGRKLAQATKVMDAMDATLDDLLAPGVSAMDRKFLAEAFDKLNKTLQTTIRLDTVDGSGKAARLALAVEFGDGTRVQTLVETK